MSEDFWIDISFGSEETETLLNRSINACWLVHKWTVETLNENLIKTLTPIRYKDFRPTLAQYIHQAELLKRSQLYSLLRASEQAFTYYNEQPKMNSEMQLVKVKPMLRSKYQEIQIEARKPWIRYLVEQRPITTRYGTIYLEGEWKETIRQQIKTVDISQNQYYYFLYLTHSITVDHSMKKKGWRMKFNIHSPNSKIGRKIERRIKKDA